MTKAVGCTLSWRQGFNQPLRRRIRVLMARALDRAGVHSGTVWFEENHRLIIAYGNAE